MSLQWHVMIGGKKFWLYYERREYGFICGPTTIGTLGFRGSGDTPEEAYENLLNHIKFIEERMPEEIERLMKEG